MLDTRPGILPEIKKKPANWKERFAVVREKLQFAAKAALFGAAQKTIQMTVLQVSGAFSVLYGISYWSIPAAFVIGGIAAIVVAERQ